MKRLLTYGLLMLTILAGLFVVSACQDELPDTTEVMMTFTTRAVTQGAASTAPVVEQMKQLRVIMLREDGTVVGNHLEPEINASSVTFTFTTPIQTGGEDFTFLAVANESSIKYPELTWEYELGTKLSEDEINQIKAQQIGNKALDINDGPIPQTKQWTVEVPQTHNHKVNQTLDFTASKISVQFLNHTMESQTLSNIYISGIGSATSGYLFAQASSDFGTQGALSDIAFTSITNLAAGTSSDVQNYYTYPVSSVSSPKLVATWNDKEYELPLEGITALNRNDHLQIVVTLVGPNEITVNYTIAEWEEEPTNIGGTPPVTPGNGYQVDDWGNTNDIIIGGESGNSGWDNLGGTIIAGGSEVFENWATLEGLGKTNWLPIEIKESYLVSGYKIAIGFTIDDENDKTIDFYFRTPWNNVISGPITYEGDGELIATLNLDNNSIEMIKAQQTGNDGNRTVYHLVATTFRVGSTQDAKNVTLTRMAIVDTNKK